MKSRWLLPTGPRIGIESTFDLSELSDGFSALIHSHSSLLPNIRGCSSAAAGFVSRFTLERVPITDAYPHNTYSLKHKLL